MINELIKEQQVSVKQACRIMRFSQSAYYYQPKKQNDQEIKMVLQTLAKKYHRWGFDMMMSWIKNAGHPWNHKRVYRVYCELKLNLRKKPKKRKIAREKQALLQPLNPNACWSIDFMSDALSGGNKIRTFNVLDDYNREGLGIFISRSIPSVTVTAYLDIIALSKGYPSMIRTDNGPEFISTHFEIWAKNHGVNVHHIEPGKPSQNAYIYP